MFKNLFDIIKNRSKVGVINFLLELTVGVLSEWQRTNRKGALDLTEKHAKEAQNDVLRGLDDPMNQFNQFNN